MRSLILGLILGGIYLPFAQAQTLVNAELVNTTLAVNRDELGIKSCGLNFMIGAMSGDNKATIYDFSVNVWHTASGLIKAGSQYMSYTKAKGWDTEKLQPRVPGPSMVWVAKRDDSVSLRPLKYIKGENPGFVLAGTDGPETLKLLLAAAQGEPMQASVQYEADRIHRVIGFRTKLTPDEQEAMLDCTNGLVKRMQAEFEKK